MQLGEGAISSVWTSTQKIFQLEPTDVILSHHTFFELSQIRFNIKYSVQCLQKNLPDEYEG